MTMLYNPDGTTRQIQPKNGVHWSLAELQELVGGYIEVLRTVDHSYMVINECGKILTPPLDLNIPATRLYVHGRRDVIVGPAVVVDTMLELDGPEDGNENQMN